MSVEFRSERPGDEEAIGVVECRAFGSMCHANLVAAYRRHYPAFDRNYSLCAWDGDELVGHALFLPFETTLLGGQTKAMALAIDGVIPERQRQGIGTALNRHGLHLARQDGFAVAVTNGGGYYARFGYHGCFGFAHILFEHNALPKPTEKLSAWPVTAADLDWLVECHQREWTGVDFAWHRGKDLREWRAPFCRTEIWRTTDGRRAAYAEGLSDGRDWHLILGDNPVLVRDAIATIKPRALQQHPRGWLAQQVIAPSWATAQSERSGAALACELQPGVLGPYLAELEQGKRLPGSFVWPLPLAVCS